MALTADGRQAISSSSDSDETLKVWDLDAFQVAAEFHAESSVFAVACASDSRTFILGETSGRLQVVRLILRQSPQAQQGTYRILVDQIPPPAEPGVVHIVLRLSIPVFAQVSAKPTSHVQFHVERKDGKMFLVGVNDGNSHDVIREIVLTTSDGQKFKGQGDSSPYILAGATRRWPIELPANQPLPTADSFQLTAHSNGGAIAQQVSVVAEP